LYKVKRVLEKTNFQDKIGIDDLQKGEPSSVLKVVHHLMFRASERFTEHIQDYVSKMDGSKAGVHSDLKYMADGKFYSSVCLILCDLFGFRADLNSNQFFDIGYAERKLIMVLNIYDILKNTRKNIKINSKLARAEVGAPRACDEAMKEY
jgi:hypothetical protein